MRAWVCMYVYVCGCVDAYVYVCVRVWVRMFVCMCVLGWVRMYIYIFNIKPYVDCRGTTKTKRSKTQTLIREKDCEGVYRFFVFLVTTSDLGLTLVSSTATLDACDNSQNSRQTVGGDVGKGSNATLVCPRENAIAAEVTNLDCNLCFAFCVTGSTRSKRT